MSKKKERYKEVSNYGNEFEYQKPKLCKTVEELIEYLKLLPPKLPLGNVRQGFDVGWFNFAKLESHSIEHLHFEEHWQ